MAPRRSIRMVLALAVFALAAIAPAAAGATPVFFAPPQYYSAEYDILGGVAAGDVTGDGHADVVAPVLQHFAVDVFPGDGTGRFGPAISVPAGASQDTVVADLNGDHVGDLVANDIYGGHVDVMLATGGGGFAPFKRYPAGDSVVSDIAVGDVDGDGDQDIVAANRASGVSVLLGGGRGAFAAPKTSATPAGPVSVGLADFDRDGHLDLAVADADGLQVEFGEGDGTFGTAKDLGPAPLSGRLAVGRLDDDAAADIAVVSREGDGTVSVFHNDGSGHFGAPSVYSTYGAGQSVTVGDVNADGRSDLVVSSGERSLGVLLNHDAEGDFRAMATQRGGAHSGFAALADFNEDGHLDVATPAGESVSVSLNQMQDGPAVDVPEDVGLGEQELGGATPRRTVFVTNVGNRPLHVGAITVSGHDAGDFELSDATCAGAVAPGESCSFKARFVPTTSGAKSVLVRIADDAPDSPQRVTLTGSAGLGVVDLSGPVAFGENHVGVPTAARTVTVHNGGDKPLSIDDVSLAGPDPGDFSVGADSCSGAEVASGGSCTIDVRFTATSRDVKVATLELSDSAAGSPHRVRLSGTGTEAVVRVRGEAFYYQRLVGRTTTKAGRERVRNIGNEPLEVSSVAITGPDADQFGVHEDQCTGASVPPGGHCDVVVAFSPTSEGGKEARLEIVDNAPGSPHLVRLDGTGIYAPVARGHCFCDFGTAQIGVPGPRHWVLFRNRGNVPLVISSMSRQGGDADQFRVTDKSCRKGPIAPGKACRFKVHFVPTRTGPKYAWVVLDSNVGLGVYVILTGNATASAVSRAGPERPGPLSAEPSRIRPVAPGRLQRRIP